EVVAHERHGLRAHVVAFEREELQAVEERESRRDARLLVPARAYAPFDELRRRRLAEVVAQRRQHQRHLPRVVEVINQLARAVAGEPGMDIYRAFGMPFRVLRHALERSDFGEELCGRAEFIEPLKAD